MHFVKAIMSLVYADRKEFELHRPAKTGQLNDMRFNSVKLLSLFI